MTGAAPEKEVIKVKKKISLFARLLSVILAFLMTGMMTLSFNITNVFAQQYESDARVKAGELKLGDIVEVGSTIYMKAGWSKYNEFDVYFDDVKVSNGETFIKCDRRAMLISKNPESQTSRKLILHFQSLGDEGNVNSEATLRTCIRMALPIELSEDIELHSPLLIDGGFNYVINTNGHSLSLDQSVHDSVIIIKDGSKLTMSNTSANGISTVSGGDAVYGGGIFVRSERSKLTMLNITVSGNNARRNGGGIFVASGSVELTDCTIENNTATENGGGIRLNFGCSLTLTNCSIENNEAKDGGGIHSEGTIIAKESKLTGNTATGNGSGIWSWGDATLTKTEISRNTHAVNGGGIFNRKNMTIIECVISGNHASQWGGGIYTETAAKTELSGGTIISDNMAATGAGIHLRKGSIIIAQSTIMNNVASQDGGGLWANSGTDASLTEVIIEHNYSSTNGGGVNSHGKLSLKDCTVNSCAANDCGGGVYIDTNESLTVTNSNIINCQSKSEGAGVYIYTGSLIFAGGKIRITNNTSDGNADNLHFKNFQQIQITGTFETGSEIGFFPHQNSVNKDITTGYSQYNKNSPAAFFRCDTVYYRINRDEKCKEAGLLNYLNLSRTSYKVKIHIKVTDDADLWDYAYFNIYARSDRGRGAEQLINTSGDFHQQIDDDDEEYTYEFDCGADQFPSAVNVKTSFGSWGTWRDFEGDVKIYINDVNVSSTHVVHNVYGDEEKNTKINIGGDKYPYPEGFEIDAPEEIDSSGVITIGAVDQYGLTWKVNGGNATMENISFPGEDTFEQADKTGLKWKLSNAHRTNHMSTYEITFLSGSNVYPKITKSINVQFVFPLYLNIMVNGKQVLNKTGYSGDSIHIADIEPPTGYYITNYDSAGVGILNKNKDHTYDFTFVNESVTLTAKLKANNYQIVFNKNGTDVTGRMTNKTTYYDTPLELSNNLLKRKGYEFVGWNTQADGMGTMFANKASVLNLTAVKGAKVTLYAIWKPLGASTTASVFSYGTGLIYTGSTILLLSILVAIFYYSKKKRQRKRMNP